jgi:hypothetical protein
VMVEARAAPLLRIEGPRTSTRSTRESSLSPARSPEDAARPPRANSRAERHACKGRRRSNPSRRSRTTWLSIRIASTRSRSSPPDRITAQARTWSSRLARDPRIFGDLLWPPFGDIDDLVWHNEDPAFTLTGHSRWVARGRILDEIRFYAAPIPGDAPSRVAAVRAEPNRFELGILESVVDAVTFTVTYLDGVDLRDIDVVRVKPASAR